MEGARGFHRGAVLAAATLSQFTASVAQQGTVVLGVFFAAAYGLSLPQMGAVVAALMLGLVLSGLVTGSLVDRYGPRRVLFWGTLMTVAVGMGIVLSRQLWPTVTLLFALGLALGVVPLSGTKAVLMLWPRERRGLPMGIRQTAVPVGAMAAALALPALAVRFGLHPLYIGFAVLLALGGLTFWGVLPHEPPRPLHATSPGVPLRNEVGAITLPAVCGFLLDWGQYAVLTYTIPFLHDRDGVSIQTAGALLAVAQVGGALARMGLGHLSDRLGGRRDVVLMATAAAGAVLAGVLAVLPLHVGLLVLVPLWFCLGAGMIGWNALVLTWSGERVSVHNAGAAMGLTTSAILFGGTVCAPLFGLIVVASGTYRAAWLTLGALLAAAALLLWGAAHSASRMPLVLPADHTDGAVMSQQGRQ